MRDFDLGREFALITLPFRPFQHLTTVEDQMACLRTIHRHLAPGGRLVLDLFNPSIIYLAAPSRLEEYEDIPQFTMPDGRRVVRHARITARDYFNQIQDVDLIYTVTYPDGRQERLVHSFPMRYLFRFEVEHLLTRCGFSVEALYGDYDKQPIRVEISRRADFRGGQTVGQVFTWPVPFIRQAILDSLCAASSEEPSRSTPMDT